MAKKKRAGAGRKTKNKSQVYMIYVVAAIMLFSAFFMGLDREVASPDAGAGQQNLNVIQYTVSPTINGSAIIRIGRPLNELVAMPTRPELVTNENLINLLNASIDGVYQTSAELTNSYIFFKFEAENATAALGDVSAAARYELREVKIYRAYEGLISGGSIYLVADPGLSSSDMVRAILLERQDTFETVGIQSERVIVGQTNSSQINVSA